VQIRLHRVHRSRDHFADLSEYLSRGPSSHRPAFILKCPFHCVGRRHRPAVARCAHFRDSSRQFVGTDVALSVGRATDLAKEDLSVSVVTALSLLLLVGFVATGLVGYLGWRERMREGAAFNVNQPQTVTNTVGRRRAIKQYDLEGAPL
jgi:hypothetical protein